jgi:hypothetical protein
MKLNWGNALLIFFILYIGTLAVVVVKSTRIDHSLVVENYYDHDIKYQEKYDKLKNRNLLEQDLGISYEAAQNSIVFNFGTASEVKQADVEMYRASNKGVDFSHELKLDENNTSTFLLPKMITGKWKVKVEWKDSSRSYYKEKDIYINQS